MVNLATKLLMIENTPLYTVENFACKLKNARYYRGYKTQAGICKETKICRQVWSLYELNKRTPALSDLTVIANFLEIDLCYFFIADAVLEDFDLILDAAKNYYKNNWYKNTEDSDRLMPFTPTTSSRQLFKVFDSCRQSTGIYMVKANSNSGISRSIDEYSKLYPEQVYVFSKKSTADKIEKSIHDIQLIIFDDADTLPENFLIRLITVFSRNLTKSIILAGKRIREVLLRIKLLHRIIRQFSMDCITVRDFNAITRAALPAINKAVLNFLRVKIDTELKRLYKIIQEITEKKKDNGKIILTIDSIMNLEK